MYVCVYIAICVQYTKYVYWYWYNNYYTICASSMQVCVCVLYVHNKS